MDACPVGKEESLDNVAGFLAHPGEPGRGLRVGEELLHSHLLLCM